MNNIRFNIIKKDLNKKKIKNLIEKIKNLKGNPHYVAKGMAIGVFVAVTPTIPFHTILAILLAMVFKGSKTAAIIGVWFSNPFTIPMFYWGSYKIGSFLLRKNEILDISQINNIADIFEIGITMTSTMVIGGLILGIIPSVLSYYITKLILNNANNKDRNFLDKSKKVEM